MVRFHWHKPRCGGLRFHDRFNQTERPGATPQVDRLQDQGRNLKKLFFFFWVTTATILQLSSKKALFFPCFFARTVRRMEAGVF